MKSLSLQRPLVLLVIGTPGAGKSFFARQFSDMFGAPLVSYDQIHFRLFTNPNHSLDELSIVTDIMKIHVGELAKTQKPFVVDGGVNSRVQRHEIQQLAKKLGYDSLIVWVQTDEVTSKKRAQRRDRRRNGDAYNHSITEQQFISLSKHLTPPQNRENVVVISGKHTYASQARAVLKRLAPQRNNQVVNTVIRQPNSPTTRSATENPPTPKPGQRRNIILS